MQRFLLKIGYQAPILCRKSNGSKSPHFKAILFLPYYDDDCIGTRFLSHVTFYNPQTLLENQSFLFSSETDNN